MRRLTRLATLSFVVLAGVTILAFLVATVAYLNRVRVINRALAILVEPFQVSVGDIHFHPLGTVRVEDLVLVRRDKREMEITARIPLAELTYRPGELRRTKRFENLSLSEPEISLTFHGPSSGDELSEGKSSSPPFSLAQFLPLNGSLGIEKGSLSIEGENLPLVSGTWDFHLGRVQFDESGRLTEPFKAALRKLEVGPKGQMGSIDSLEVSGTLTTDLSQIDLETVRLQRPVFRLTPRDDRGDSPKKEMEKSPSGQAVSNGEKPSSFRLTLAGLELSDGRFELTGFDGTNGRARLPNLSFESTFSLPALRLEEGSWKSEGAIELPLFQVSAGSGKLPFFSAGSVLIGAESLQTLIRDQRIASVEIRDGDLLASDETLSRFLAESTRKTESPSPSGSPWILESLRFTRTGVAVRDLHLSGKETPALTASISGDLQDLRFGGEAGFDSEGTQQLRLEQTRLHAPGSRESPAPLLSIEFAEAEFAWRDFQSKNRIARLDARGPRIEFTDEALGDWLNPPSGPDTPRPVNRPVYRVTDLEVTGGKLSADSSFAGGRVPKLNGDFSLNSRPDDSGGSDAYRLRLAQVELRNHPRTLEFIGPPRPDSLSPAGKPSSNRPGPLAEGEVFRVGTIEADFTATGLQRNRRVEHLKIDEATLTVGEGLKSLVDGDAAPEKEADAPTSATPPSPAPAAPSPPDQASTKDGLPTWTLGTVEITRSRVHFESLIPQVEGLQFAIETRLEEVPLSLDGLLAQEKLQKIELAGIEIRDPYNSFITVAELPTIFVEFSLAGLARQQIEKIDLIGPSLHVGQGLFWWIDYQRKFRAQNEGASIGIESGVAVEQKPDWVIRTINATAGKIIISPTGVPVGVVPFPFNATTNMSEGNIELELNIPDEDHVYRFPDYKVELQGLAGDVKFNVPVKDVNNNLVQTFTLRKAKWKDYDAEDLYITVTFDADGIYGKFGGAAYQGYAEGQFNFYLNDPGKWDAWLAGTDLDTGPVTRIIAPDSFLMDGLVSLKILSEGRDKQVGETSGEFQTTTPGWFDITKLDAMLEKLPPEWNSLQTSLTELSLIALKRFDYDKGTGSLYLLNREGSLKMHFAGPYGTRALNLQVHDQRNTNDTTAARPETAAPPEPDAPLPEASARPVGPPRLAGARKSR
ncbi:MAG: hypothetical protein KDN18_22755 [Verrucomicrobiae bacterium]|nr:hypothetical protein [Verrucomicrobiae bacterium]